MAAAPLRKLLPLLLLSLTLAEDATASAAAKKASSHSGASSPFNSFTKSLPQEKKKPFMELMKRLRGAKAASVGTKDEKKKVMSSLDSDIHKLLGTEYKRYRTVQHTQKELHVAKKSSSGGTSTPVPAPAPVAATPPPATSSSPKKKKSGLPGSSKKKSSSTTVG